MDQHVLQSLKRACNDRGLLTKLVTHALAVHRESLVSQVFVFSDALPCRRLSGHMDKLSIPLKLGFTPVDGSLDSPAFVQDKEGHNPNLQLQCWRPSSNGAAAESLAEH